MLFVAMAGLGLVGILIQFVVPGAAASSLPTTGRPHAADWLSELAPVVIVAATTIGSIWGTLQLALRPIRRLSQQAGAIGPNTLHERLPLQDAPAEIAPLVAAFNASLDRLETAWAAHRAFSSSAAHELRSPLAALRALVESLLPAAERKAASAEFERLGRLIEQLLILAEADHERLSRCEAFDLAAVARAAAAAAAPALLQGATTSASAVMSSAFRAKETRSSQTSPCAT